MSRYLQEVMTGDDRTHLALVFGLLWSGLLLILRAETRVALQFPFASPSAGVGWRTVFFGSLPGLARALWQRRAKTRRKYARKRERR